MIGSTILVALTTLLASPGTESLVWQKDYATALQKGKETWETTRRSSAGC